MTGFSCQRSHHSQCLYDSIGSEIEKFQGIPTLIVLLKTKLNCALFHARLFRILFLPFQIHKHTLT